VVDREDGDGGGSGLASRVARLERDAAALGRAMAASAREVRTRRLVVIDGDGNEVVVAETGGGTAELRVQIPGSAPGRTGAVVLFATAPDRGPGPDAGPGSDLGPGVGLQLWAGGDAVAELDAWPGDDGCWRSGLHLDAGT